MRISIRIQPQNVESSALSIVFQIIFNLKVSIKFNLDTKELRVTIGIPIHVSSGDKPRLSLTNRSAKWNVILQ